jgi:hypothetical protein
MAECLLSQSPYSFVFSIDLAKTHRLEPVKFVMEFVKDST